MFLILRENPPLLTVLVVVLEDWSFHFYPNYALFSQKYSPKSHVFMSKN